MAEQVSLFAPDTWYGKTSREPLAPTRAKISQQSSKKRSVSSARKPPLCLCLKKDGPNLDASTMTWEDGVLLGEFTMHSFGESPREENASLLSQILEDSPHPKYYLSEKACLGILKRAERRGKELPPELKEALLAQSRSKSEAENLGGGKGILIQEERTGSLSTLNNQSVFTFDARGNGDGAIACTITGDHQNRVTDYTALAVANGQLNQISMAEHANTLDTMRDQQMVLEKSCFQNTGQGWWNAGPIAQTIRTACGGDSTKANLVAEPEQQNFVRRLTPLECERLQGYPDGWTDIGPWTDSKGKLHKESSDTARYKALGNSIALPFWFWLMRRISAQYERPATLGSLFDGIGGFPLCWERCNGKGTALWASEIEEFPIAVTKVRFPET